jgi:hypothetical protein
MDTLLLALTLMHATLAPRPCGIVVKPPASAHDRTDGPLAAVCPQPPGQSPTLVVRLYDAARVPSPFRREARNEAARILRKAGLQVTWTVCGRQRTPAGKSDPCAPPPGANDVIVRLVRNGRMGQESVLGYSYVPGVVATAVVDRIEATSRRNGVPIGTLLGAVVAHEIAHLVFGPAHAASGLMRPVWTDGEIRARASLQLHERQTPLEASVPSESPAPDASYDGTAP